MSTFSIFSFIVLLPLSRRLYNRQCLSVCLFVCLVVCEQDSATSLQAIFMKPCRSMD